ncbi:MAG TPA: hypothetical protein VF433_12085 [Cellvibrio sp.]
MKCPAKFANESARLNALSNYGLDGEQMLQSLDPVVRIASRMFDMPVAAVNMIGSDHVFLLPVWEWEKWICAAMYPSVPTPLISPM